VKGYKVALAKAKVGCSKIMRKPGTSFHKSCPVEFPRILILPVMNYENPFERNFTGDWSSRYLCLEHAQVPDCEKKLVFSIILLFE
jgi:hypothetical protein